MTKFASSVAPKLPLFRTCWFTTFPKTLLFAAILFVRTLDSKEHLHGGISGKTVANRVGVIIIRQRIC
jgi:hypothetical protein